MKSTPAHTLDTLKPFGGFWRRTTAYGIDGLAIWVLLMLFEFFIGVGFGLKETRETTMDDPAVMFLLQTTIVLSIPLIAWLYFAGLESSRWQATLGKHFLRLKVANLYGCRIGFLQATFRFIACTLNWLTLGIGYLMIIWTQAHRGLHDYLAHTCVMHVDLNKSVLDPEAPSTSA